MRSTIHIGDCIETMRAMPDNSIDSIVTDPPYELGFMGKAWDASGIAYNVEMWRQALRVLKPGGHLLAFSGSRTYHRMTCAIEDAGFEIRDQVMWVYGSGFPKSLNVSKAVDGHVTGGRSDSLALKQVNETRPGDATVRPTSTNGHRGIVGSADAGASVKRDQPATPEGEQWDGWGTALKPAHEPICVARKPLVGTVAANVLSHGTGALNIAACRVGTEGGTSRGESGSNAGKARNTLHGGNFGIEKLDAGRWPANLIHDGSPEVVALFPESTSGAMKAGTQRAAQDGPGSVCFGTYGAAVTSADILASTGSAARFFYCAKASKSDRGDGNTHPTVKPTDVMAYLVRLVTPPGGLVLDPFMGSGSTGKAAIREGFRFIGCELSAEYAAIAEARIADEISIPKQWELL